MMPIRVTIDGKQIEVEPGTSLLQAACLLGIELPTLCSADGLEPVGSCFLCVVHVKGKERLSPACVEQAADGMVVTTDSEEIRAARKAALELLLSDHAGDCEAPCSLACPAGLDIPGLIRHIAAGREDLALALIKERIPLPGVLGRICARYCERACRRGDLDEAIAICALERFVADRAGKSRSSPPGPPTGKKVAIVGAGPAGLSAAYYLRLMGHACTILDANPEPGGRLRYALPEFRLPRHILRTECDAIRELGVAFRANVRIDDEEQLAVLRRSHDAVLLAIGAQLPGRLPCEGAELAISASEYLREASQKRVPPHQGPVVVLGDGEEAFDAGRTALRLGADSVTILFQRERGPVSSSREMLAEAEAEGIHIELGAAVERIERIGHTRLQLAFFREGEPSTLTAETIINASERRVDLNLASTLGLDLSERGIAADRHTFVTNLRGVFAAGDAVTGPGSVARAVAAGRLAALSIGQYLQGEEPSGEARRVIVRMGRLDERELAIIRGEFPKSPRHNPPIADPARRRTNFEEIVGPLQEHDARDEARRCLQCDCMARESCKLRRYAKIYGADPTRFKGERRPFQRDASHPDVVYESGKCILCGLCVRLAEKCGAKPGLTFTRRGFATTVAVPFGGKLAEALDSETARRCAALCPTGALARKRSEVAPEDLQSSHTSEKESEDR